MAGIRLSDIVAGKHAGVFLAPGWRCPWCGRRTLVAVAVDVARDLAGVEAGRACVCSDRTCRTAAAFWEREP